MSYVITDLPEGWDIGWCHINGIQAIYRWPSVIWCNGSTGLHCLYDFRDALGGGEAGRELLLKCIDKYAKEYADSPEDEGPRELPPVFLNILRIQDYWSTLVTAIQTAPGIERGEKDRFQFWQWEPLGQGSLAEMLYKDGLERCISAWLATIPRGTAFERIEAHYGTDGKKIIDYLLFRSLLFDVEEDADKLKEEILAIVEKCGPLPLV